MSEGLFYLGLGELPRMTMDRSAETRAKKFEGIVVEGRFLSSLSPKRLGTSVPPAGSSSFQLLVGDTGYQAQDLPERTSAFLCAAFFGALRKAWEQEKEARSTPQATSTVNVDRSGFLEQRQDNDPVRICTTIQQTCRTERLVADPEVFCGQMAPANSRRGA